ncbi:TolC family protein [Aromatoleum toluolicum]|uniref:Transporter n=1 Tax=Aromatoleum toluolicum TaxID=90060 RepID=A0ABX1NH26_9RHOO|nr:TolC family protein [Aromatoleum toluolicum]NMF98485.1 TolC family protein [Aromatoleum toluolicum]
MSSKNTQVTRARRVNSAVPSLHTAARTVAEMLSMTFRRTLSMRRIVLLGLAVSCPAAAQQAALHASGEAGTQSIRHAVEAAWQRSADGRAAAARRDEAVARRDAATSWTPEPPTFTLSQRSDRLHRNDGQHEVEAELEMPLWMPGTRAAASALADAQGDELEARLALARLKLAGEVREAVWSLRLAQNDLDANQRRVAEAEVLAADVQRRVVAGDLARIDANTAQAAVQQARAAMAEAQARLLREQRLYSALTGLPQPPVDREADAVAGELDSHPALIARRRAAELARAHLHQASTATRDAPELILGVTSERGEFGERYTNTTTIGIRVPFGTDARNRPQISAANAELIDAETTFALERERLRAELDATRDEFYQARRVESFAAERARLAADSRQLVVKAFDLGQVDLPTRLRAENEYFDAELSLSRARSEAGRAASRLQQANGLLP